MSQDFCRHILRVAMAQICQSLGWHAIQSTPMEVMTDILERYLLHIGKFTHRYCEQFGRTQPNLDDLAMAFLEMKISLPELADYHRHVDPLPFAHEVPQFPVPQKLLLNFPKPGSRELLERKEHIDDHYPPMRPEWNDEVVEATPSGSSLNRSSEALAVPPSPTTPGDKRSFLTPTDSSAKKSRLLPDEARHSQYEMKGISMSDHGHLTPSKMGKLPEACTPPPPTPSVTEPSSPSDLMPSPPVSPKGSVIAETVEIRTMVGDDDLSAPSSPAPLVPSQTEAPESPLVTPPKPTKFKSPKFKAKEKRASKSPVRAAKPKTDEIKARKKKVKKIKSDEFVDDVTLSEAELENLNSPASLSPMVQTGDRFDKYKDSIDSVLQHSKLLEEEREEQERQRKREEEEERERERIRIEKEREADLERERERIRELEAQQERERQHEEEERRERERQKQKERELEAQRERERLREEEEKRKMEEERARREEREREKQREKERKEAAKREKKLKKESEKEKASFFRFDDVGEDIFETPALPSSLNLHDSRPSTPAEASPRSPLLEKKSKKDRKQKSSSSKSHKLKINIASTASESYSLEDKLKQKIQSPEWPKVSLEKLTPEDIRNFEYPSPEKHLSPIHEAHDEAASAQPPLMPIRIGLNMTGKDFTIKPPRTDEGSKEHKKEKKKKKNKDKDKERDHDKKEKRDKKYKKDKKKDKKDKDKKEKPADEGKPAIPKLTLKFGGIGGKGSSTVTVSASSDNTPRTSPSKVEDVLSPPYKMKSPPLQLPSPIAVPSSSPSPDRSPPHIPFRALHNTPSPVSRSPSLKNRSPSPPTLYTERAERSRSRSPFRVSDFLPSKGAPSLSPVQSHSPEIQRKRRLSTPPPRTPSPASSSYSSSNSPPRSPPLPTVSVLPTVAAKAGKGPPGSKGVISETLGKIVDERGQITWICPTCKKVDDGTPMIGCDECDDWYHWVCVGITCEPADDKWYCVRCSANLGLSHRGRGGPGRGKRGRRGSSRGMGAKRGRKKLQ